jgi:predicted PurR-regulated permease PerM
MVVGLQRNLKLGRIMGTLVLYLIVFLTIFVLLAFLIPTLISQFIILFETLKDALPKLLDRLVQSELVQIDAALVQQIRDRIAQIELDYEKVAGWIWPAMKKVASGGFEAVGQAAKGIFSGIGSLVGFMTFVVFVGIINFYLIIDWEKIRPNVRKMVPRQYRNRVFDVLDKMDLAMGGFLRGQLTVALIVGSLFAIGLFGLAFIGFPALRNYSILIGTAAGIAGFIPYLGAVIGVTPAILIILLTGDISWTTKLFSLCGVLVLFSVIQAIEGFVLQPRIVGKGAGLHPLVVMLALFVGAQFGIGGMIIAVPLASVIRVLIREFYWLPLERKESVLVRREELADMSGEEF